MSFKEFINTNKSEIFTGFAISGMILSVVLGVEATPRAMKKIEKKKEELGVDKLSAWETVKTAGPCYIPTLIVMTATGYSIIRPVHDEMNKGYVLATSLMISEEARKKFEEKAKEVVGEKKVNEIKEEVAKDEIKNNPVPNSGVPMIGAGKLLVHDSVTNQYFRSDYETVRQIINDLNFRLNNGNEMYITVNDYCRAFNMNTVPWGNDLRWEANKRQLDPKYYTEFAPNGEVCMVIDFDKDDYLNL